MPHEHNAAHRHHISKMANRVTNWPVYEACLRNRGSLTLWISPGALTQWQAPRRPTLSVARLPDGPLDVLVDSTGLQVYGAGQWLQEKHGVKSRRRWRKLHLAVDADTGQIVAHTLTYEHGDDPSQVAPLLEQIPGELGRFIADGAYDGAPTYQTVTRHSASARIVIPPRATAVRSCETGPPTQCDHHLEAIATQGRLAWQKATGYGRRARVETTMGRYKALIGVAALNRMLAAARPNSVRCKVHVA
ncbi:IS5 family transposase [Burkholderia vietnamiensis]|nr:IS5 family transposase [Burkholderia vietnamiensis]